MKKYSIPTGLAINECSRLLAYLKVKFHDGYFLKSQIEKTARLYQKDIRTFKNSLQALIENGLIGQDCKAFYLRSWKFISAKENFNLQSFECSIDQLTNKEKFEVLLFAAKLTSIKKAIRKGMARVRATGFTDQIAIPTGFLAEACNISTGKVTKLKRQASALRLIEVAKSFEDHGAGTIQTVRIAARESPGLFLCQGRILKRRADQIESKILTYKIKNRKYRKGKAASLV